VTVVAARRVVVVLLIALVTASGATLGFAKEKSKKKKTADLPPEQVYEQAEDKIAHKRYYTARTMLQELLPRIPPEDRDLLPRVHLALAEAFFKDGGLVNYGEALNAYRNFLTYFPQHEKAPYAQLMVGESMYRQVLAPDRDQAMTLKAIDELRKVETVYPKSPYVTEARNTIALCYDRLAEKERLVGKYYQKRKVWPAAVDRYRTVLDKYPQYTSMNRIYLEMGRCLLALNRRDEAQDLFNRLAAQDACGLMTRQAKGEMAAYDRRREKEGEKLYGDLSGQAPKPSAKP
jgi:outer membrane protein assembly factor BamD